MSRSAIEQALTSLIPRHNGPPPQELVDLASSLLAQSRVKASTLKPDEEIGRTYACANIACERLKQSLNLPQIEPRPPVAPRVYKNLYSYLESALAVRKRGRPPKPVSANATPVVKQPRGRPSPAKALASVTKAPTPSDTPRARGGGQQFTAFTKDISPWIHPVIRALCKDLRVPAAAPHILAGVTTILSDPEVHGSGNQADTQVEHVSGLIVAIYFFVTTRLLGRETSGKEYVVQRKRLLDCLSGLRSDEELQDKVRRKSTGDEKKDWAGWSDENTKDIDAWLLRISRSTWLKMDWFENIVEGSGVDVNQHLGDDGAESDVEDKLMEDQSNAQTGLGTMIQDSVDYLSEKKRNEYKVWKDSIMARIEAKELEYRNENMQAA